MPWIPYFGAAVNPTFAAIGYLSQVIIEWSQQTHALLCEQLEELAASGR